MLRTMWHCRRQRAHYVPCVCMITCDGGVELGGGVLHGPIDPGAREDAVRRLTIRHERPVPPAQGPFRWVYEAEGEGPLRHAVGRAEEDGWSANTVDDDAGHLVFGPYDPHWPAQPLTAEFELMIDVIDAPDSVVVTLDIFDFETQAIVAEMAVPRSAFRAPFEYQTFTVAWDNVGRSGHAMEARVDWHDNSYVRVRRVVVEER